MKNIKIYPKDRDSAFLLLVAYIHCHSEDHTPSEHIDTESLLPEKCFNRFFSRSHVIKMVKKNKKLKDIEWHKGMKMIDLLNHFFPLPKIKKTKKRKSKNV